MTVAVTKLSSILVDSLTGGFGRRLCFEPVFPRLKPKGREKTRGPSGPTSEENTYTASFVASAGIALLPTVVEFKTFISFQSYPNSSPQSRQTT
jgi:hypothetical protein